MNPEILFWVWIFGAFCSYVAAHITEKNVWMRLILTVGWFVVIPIILMMKVYED